MPYMTFGDYSVDMIEPGFLGLGEYFPSPEFQLVSVSQSQIIVRDPISSATVALTGAFNLSSEATFLASEISGMVWRTAGGDLLLSGGLPHIKVADVAVMPDPETFNAMALKGDDEIIGGKSDDVIRGYDGDDRIYGKDGADVLYGDAGNDKLSGDAGKDRLIGGSGNDSLLGGTGDDELSGGPGSDTLDGGDGRDVAQFQGRAADYVVSAGAGSLPTVAGTTAMSQLADGTDALISIESLQFADRTYAFTPPLPSVPVGGETEVVAIPLPPDTYGSLTSVVESLKSGNLVVVWWQPFSIEGRIFSSDLQPEGGTFPVSVPASDSSQEVIAPDVTALADGGFVVTWWAATMQDGYMVDVDVHGRVFGANGDPTSDEFLVNTRTDSSEYRPAVAGLTGGGFVAVWERGGPTIAAQLFDANGNRVNNEFDIAGYGAASPDVAALADGGFVVVWDAGGQRYDAAASPIGGPFVLDGTPGVASAAKVATLSDGGFVVMWDASVTTPIGGSFGDFIVTTGVFAQRFLADGAKAGGVIEVVPISGPAPFSASIVGLADGGFTVALDEGYYGTAKAVRYDADGHALGQGLFSGPSPAAPAWTTGGVGCAALPDGGFLMTWAESWMGADFFWLHAQRYAADWSAAEISTIEGTALADTIHAGAGPQVLIGGGGNDTLIGGPGDDRLDGGAGVDAAVFSGRLSNFTISKAGQGLTVSDATGQEGTDSVTSIERLQFTNLSVAFDLDGTAGKTAELIGAIFGSQRLLPEYVGIGIGLLDAGQTMQQAAQLALDSTLFLQLAGSHNNADFVRLVYENVMGAAPSAAEQAYYQGLLDRGDMTQAHLAMIAAESDLNKVNIDLVGLNERGIEFIPIGG